MTQAPALVDSSGVGDPVVEQLQRQGDGLFEGFKFSAQSKQQLMEGLAVAIQQRGVAYPAGVLVQELESFEYVYTRTGVQYSAPAGRHDDGVCALALAVRRLTVMTDGWGFLAWADEQVAAAKAGRPTVCTRDLGHAPSSDTPPEEENPWLAALRKENGPPRRIW